MPLVHLSDASFGYRRRAVVAGVSCAVAPGGCLGIYGPNGVGKSTLLRGITGLLRPMVGVVSVADGVRFGYMPQQRAGEPHWPMTALDAACIATSAHRRFGLLGSHKRLVRAHLAEMGLNHLAREPFFELSGGQQQRVLLAGALAADPQVLLLDEPMSGVDARARDLLLDRLSQAKQRGLAIILVSHEASDLLALADQHMVLKPSDDAGEPSTAQRCSAEEMVAFLSQGRRSGSGDAAGAGGWWPVSLQPEDGP